jgi:uncharacterized Fe-S cluster-containing radical SAM superfamily protein
MHPTPNGDTRLCCVGGVVGDMNKNTPEEIWNNDNYKRIRRNMLNNIPNTECKICVEQEKFNSQSLRLNSNERWYNSQLPENKESINKCKELVKRTREDGKADFKIMYMDFRVSNLCNFKCRMCHHSLSSEWYEDAKILDETEHKNPDTKVIQIKKLTDNFEGFIDRIIPDIEHIYWAGGEPLLTDEHWVTMQKIVDQGRTKDITVLYNTNGSRLTYKDKRFIDLIREFPKVSITISLDGSHRRGEYIRKGLNYSEVRRNIKYLKEKLPHIKLGIQFSLTVYNAWHMTDFYDECVEDLGIDPQNFTINFCHAPEHYRCSVLPPAIKTNILTKWDDFLGYCLQNNFSQLADQVQGAIKLLKEDYTPLLPKFLTYTDKLDSMRNDDFYATFPEYANLKETHYSKWNTPEFQARRLEKLLGIF